MITLIYKSLYDTALLSNVKKCYAEYRREVIRQQIIETTGKGFLYEKFGRQDCEIITAYSHNDVFTCEIESRWGKIHINATLSDLPGQLESIMDEKREYDKMMTMVELDI